MSSKMATHSTRGRKSLFSSLARVSSLVMNCPKTKSIWLCTSQRKTPTFRLHTFILQATCHARQVQEFADPIQIERHHFEHYCFLLTNTSFSNLTQVNSKCSKVSYNCGWFVYSRYQPTGTHRAGQTSVQLCRDSRGHLQQTWRPWPEEGVTGRHPDQGVYRA